MTKYILSRKPYICWGKFSNHKQCTFVSKHSIGIINIMWNLFTQVSKLLPNKITRITYECIDRIKNTVHFYMLQITNTSRKFTYKHCSNSASSSPKNC